jgi:prepilin signal peptidase PulO-like enzyme (type II secretory pathway)
MITNLLDSASQGILSIRENPITLILFLFFLTWASITDLRTLKVRDYQNGSFLAVGVLLFIIQYMDVFDTGFNLGVGHIFGAIVGFLILFIPGMIKNYAFGGDIKFVAVMGFWVGPAAIILILAIATLLQLTLLYVTYLFKKDFGTKSRLPFAPAFSLAYIVSVVILLIF